MPKLKSDYVPSACDLENLVSRIPFVENVAFRQRSLSMDSVSGFLGYLSNSNDSRLDNSYLKRTTLMSPKGSRGSVSSITSENSDIRDDLKIMVSMSSQSCSSEEEEIDIEELVADETNKSKSFDLNLKSSIRLAFPLGQKWLAEISKGFGVKAAQLIIESLDNEEVMEEFSVFLRNHENRHLVAKLVRQGSLRESSNLSFVPPGHWDEGLTIPNFKSMSYDQFMEVCRDEMGSALPIERNWQHVKSEQGFGLRKDEICTETVRVLHWNVLSQTLGTKCDKFVRCPDEALNWSTRRFRLLFEIMRHSPDVICLQEVDHYIFLHNWLSTLGFSSFFMPKPDSPCIHMSENNGPDGCAIFFDKNKFDLVNWDKHILDAYGSKGNQVLLSVILRSKLTSKEFVISTTHLKARYNQLLLMIRREQSKDILNHVKKISRNRPIIITGDFNAEPNEPAYTTMIQSESLRLGSAYSDEKGFESPYTTWKHREDGEHIETLDYIFYSKENLRVKNLLTMPSPNAIGEGRLPSHAFPSDHLTLACDFNFL